MKVTVASNGVRFYYSDKIPCPHAFSTRVGGVSQQSETATLNLGVDRGDPLPVVLQNLMRFGEAVGFSAETVISAPQIHSVKLRYVTEANKGEGFFRPSQDACDGYYTDHRGVTLGVRTADCVPILFYGETEEGKPRIAAVHAGWRGSADGIALHAVEAMEKMGVVREALTVAIGPAIGSCCYEVQTDFCDEILRRCGAEIASKCLIQRQNGAWFADVRRLNQLLLCRFGVLPEHMDISEECTCCAPTEFFSHRFSKATDFRRGTMLSVITLGETKTEW